MVVIKMESKEKQIENELIKVGKELSKLPSSIDKLLFLLDQVGSCLSVVDQVPSMSIKNALSPIMKALVANELLRHSDMDVKVAFASCIIEITRITAPVAPYADEQLKEIFQLIIALFGEFETSHHSYSRKVLILETMAKLRLYLVMLDLECDTLILEMFRNFLMSIREFHPESIFTCMETIMSCTLEECDDITPKFLSPILISVKKDNQDVLPIRRKLAEKVLENCSSKLKPNLKKTIESMGLSLNDFSKVVSSICQETSDEVKDNHVNVSEEHMAPGKPKKEKSSRCYQSAVKPSVVKPSDAALSGGKGRESGVQSDLTEVVEGFTVPKNFAALYRSIYQHHGGHIATTKIINAPMMSFEALVADLLEVISSMAAAKFSDVDHDLLQCWEAKIFRAEAIEFNVGWLRKRMNLLKDTYITMNTLKTTLDQSEGALAVAQQELVMALEARETFRAQLVTADNRLAKAENELMARKSDVESKAAEKAKLVTLMGQPLLNDLF